MTDMTPQHEPDGTERPGLESTGLESARPDATGGRRWLALAGGAAAVAVAIALVVWLSGGDDSESSTSLPSGSTSVTSTTGSTTASTIGSASTAPGSTDPDASPTSIGPAPTTDASGSPTTAPAQTAPAQTGPPTTGVPPSPSSLVTVPTGTVPVADPIDTDEVGDFGTGVTARVVLLEAVDGVAVVPGQTSAPAVRVTVELTNGSDEPLVLGRALVEITYGADRTPGGALTEPGAAPFQGELAPGDSATGVYVFGVPIDQRGQVQVQVFAAVGSPIIVFEGPAPTA